MKPLVLYHDRCWDGFCAAWVLWHFHPDGKLFEFVPANYGEDPPDVKDRFVYVVDFSYPRDVLLRMDQESNGLVVLDHHKTAKDELEGLDFCTFDMSKSGARLTWEYVQLKVLGQNTAYNNGHVPWLVTYTEDRDLWNWELEDSREINAGLRSYPLEFTSWDEFHQSIEWFSRMRSDGEAILRDQANTVAAKVSQSHQVGWQGSKVLVCNATTLISETAGAMADTDGIAFGCCWFEKADGSRVYSLRNPRDAEKSIVSVAEIAKQYGGGGHLGAAGFTLPAGSPHPWN